MNKKTQNIGSRPKTSQKTKLTEHSLINDIKKHCSSVPLVQNSHIFPSTNTVFNWNFSFALNAN